MREGSSCLPGVYGPGATDINAAAACGPCRAAGGAVTEQGGPGSYRTAPRGDQQVPAPWAKSTTRQPGWDKAGTGS